MLYADWLSKYYDPRVWVREGEKTLSERVKEACKDLGNFGMPRPFHQYIYDNINEEQNLNGVELKNKHPL